MTLKEEILSKLKNTYTRLKPSPIGGVGVFAIRNIPKDVSPFPPTKKTRWALFHTSELKDIDKEVYKMIDDFVVIEKDGTVYIPDYGLNAMDASYFVNHSKTPNLKTIDDGFTFITLRNIKKGEELTIDYGTYDYKY